MNTSNLRVAFVAILVWVACGEPATQQETLFSFHSNAWLNLHHYVRAVARGGADATGLSDAERTQWLAGVEFYKGYVPRDLVRDDGMIAIKNELRSADGRTNLGGIAIDNALKMMLERLMPIYQTHWWPAHDRANREWITALQPIVARHGPGLSQAFARVYDVRWPREPIAVDLSVTAGPNDAYGTSDPAHITISPTFRDYTALEMLVHESTHGLVPVFAMVSQAAGRQKVEVPPQLWHALLFYTAGELTTRELRSRGIDYTPVADANFLDGMCGRGCRDKIVEHWTPRVDGRRSIADSLSALVGAFR